jgi:hypothetical protein
MELKEGGIGDAVAGEGKWGSGDYTGIPGCACVSCMMPDVLWYVSSHVLLIEFAFRLQTS